VNVTNTSGATAYLNVWADWNKNNLADAGEQIATNHRDRDRNQQQQHRVERDPAIDHHQWHPAIASKDHERTKPRVQQHVPWDEPG
jgi:hypothetical protein